MSFNKICAFIVYLQSSYYQPPRRPNNRPFPSLPQPPFQSEAKCEKSVFIHIEIGSNYHNKNFAHRLALKERLRGTRKWPIAINQSAFHLHSGSFLGDVAPVDLWECISSLFSIPTEIGNTELTTSANLEEIYLDTTL